MKLQKINNVQVRPIVDNEITDKKILGSKLFPEPFCNIFICAKKKSGKTTVIYKILHDCCHKRTRVFLFASTVHKDATYKKIIAYLEKKDVEVQTFTGLYDDQKQNIVKDILRELGDEEMSCSDSEDEDMGLHVNFGDEVQTKPRKYRPSKIYPEVIFIFDDLGNTLRDPAIDSLLKVNRHYKSKVIISSQYLNDLSPQARLQLDYVLLFRGLPMEKLLQIYKDTDLAVDFDDFVQMYGKATEARYQFLYVDVRQEKYRVNFNIEFQ